MWGKREQVILWTTSYLPLILIMLYRFIDGNNFFKNTKWALWLKRNIGKELFEFFLILLIITFSLLLFRLITNWLFNDFDDQLKMRRIGRSYSVRKYQKISVNDYSFFLITLLLPLFSIDNKSVVNLVVTLFIIIVIIVIYVKTDSISICPLFFTSGRNVYRAEISDQTKEIEKVNPLVRLDVIIIIKERTLDLNNKFRVQKLVANVYYLTTS
ncbi:hypothetical protein Desaci_1233 [Desulfosporosinus acidiphilus SJ4]|uniref:Uncharacterized protein n=2 Tax=Desulfosporosinus TaxID=79206 RepID=I4D389_DESAJ|nr:hypothetical protein Desaci_1233 [Desulfosporosinus acidiphilus SJ4]